MQLQFKLRGHLAIAVMCVLGCGGNIGAGGEEGAQPDLVAERDAEASETLAPFSPAADDLDSSAPPAPPTESDDDATPVEDSGAEDTASAAPSASDSAAPTKDSALADTAPTKDAAVADTAPPPKLGEPAGNVTLTNVVGEKIKARFALPATSAGEKHPAVIVLHGSGGLFQLPSAADTAAGRTCSDKLENQFTRWQERLTALGYVVLMPDSFGSRGYCDEYKDARRSTILPPVAGDEDGKTRRLLSRIYDLYAAHAFLCADPRVRCDRVGMVGFSNGGSAVMLGLHQKLGTTFKNFAASAVGKGLGVPIPPLPSETLPLKVGVAYYPGCGFDGILSMTTDTAKVDDFFYPTIKTRILIGSKDSLLPNCSVTVAGEGRREIQAKTYATLKSAPDRYDITVFNQAEHSFDVAGCETSTATDANTTACRDSLKDTLALLAALKAP